MIKNLSSPSISKPLTNYQVYPPILFFTSLKLSFVLRTSPFLFWCYISSPLTGLGSHLTFRITVGLLNLFSCWSNFFRYSFNYSKHKWLIYLWLWVWFHSCLSYVFIIYCGLFALCSNQHKINWSSQTMIRNRISLYLLPVHSDGLERKDGQGIWSFKTHSKSLWRRNRDIDYDYLC